MGVGYFRGGLLFAIRMSTSFHLPDTSLSRSWASRNLCCFPNAKARFTADFTL